MSLLAAFEVVVLSPNYIEYRISPLSIVFEIVVIRFRRLIVCSDWIREFTRKLG